MFFNSNKLAGQKGFIYLPTLMLSELTSILLLLVAETILKKSYMYNLIKMSIISLKSKQN